MSGAVEIVAVGARTPVGLGAGSTAAAVRGGLSRRREYSFVDPTGEPVVVASDARIGHDVEGPARLRAMGESVIDQIARELERKRTGKIPCVLFLALPEARPGFSDDDGTALAETLGAHLAPVATRAHVEIAGRGHAGSIRAVELAMAECARSPDVLFLVAGVDSYLHPDTFTWLERDRRFAQTGIRSGLTPGEGAGCVALASPRLRRSLGLPNLAVIRDARTAEEAHARGTQAESFGVGLSAAVLGAVAGLDLPRQAVDVLYTDLNGERYRSDEWGFVALRTSTAWRSLDYEAPADSWGDVGAAFGVLAGVLAVQSYARGYARGPRALVTAGSDGGLRGAMLLQHPAWRD